MPAIQSPLSQKLSYLHALWADPNATCATDLTELFKKETTWGNALAAYRTACTDNKVGEATGHLATIRDLLLTPVPPTP